MAIKHITRRRSVCSRKKVKILKIKWEKRGLPIGSRRVCLNAMSTTIEDLLTATTAQTTDTTEDTATPGLGVEVQKHIGNLLKVSFQEMLTEPVPDRFSQLLEQLEQAEKSKVK